MNKGHKQIDMQMQQLGIGKSTTQRVEAYIKMWMDRCYSNGIPDQLPRHLESTNRAPSYRKIAIAILKNDMKLRTLGFTEANYNNDLSRDLERLNDKQMSIF